MTAGIINNLEDKEFSKILGILMIYLHNITKFYKGMVNKNAICRSEGTI